MKLIECPSPNFDARKHVIDTIVLHYTGMRTGEEALERLCDPAANVSAHYLVEEDGRVFHLVAEENRAWHAGIAYWKGDSEINARAIGVEIVNPGHEWEYREFPDVQIDAAIALLKDIRTRHEIPLQRVLAHSDVAPTRKDDPGEKFPWARLAAAGVAIGPYAGPPDKTIPYTEAVAALRSIGYEVYDIVPGIPATAAALLAFQRRFCPAALGQGWSPQTKAALVWAAEAMR